MIHFRFLSVLCLMILLGCATTVNYQQIRDVAHNVNAEDGIDSAEAIVLAQDFLLKKGLYDQLVSIKPYRIWKEIIWEKDGEEVLLVREPAEDFQFAVKQTWILYWKDKRNSIFDIFPVIPFYVELDAETGIINKWGLRDK